MGLGSPFVLSLKEKFDARWEPEANSGCWLWSGTLDGNKRAVFGVGYKVRIAARVSWELNRGPIPAEQCVCHRCDTRACVNPEHLFLGTQTDNVADMDVKGRRNAPRGVGHGMHKLTPESVMEMRQLRKQDGITLDELGSRFGVTKQCAHNAITGKTWAHL